MTNHERKLKQARRLERDKDKLKNEGTLNAIKILLVIPLYIMATEYNFGNKRLWKFCQRMISLVQVVSKDTHLIDVMCDEMRHDKGIAINFDKEIERDEDITENLWYEEKGGKIIWHRKEWK